MLKKFVIFSGLLLSTCISLAATSSTSETQQLLRRISMLEYALAPVNPNAVVITWAKAAKNRNGAVQYMLLCPNLQKVNLKNLEELNWVTGISNPSVSSYNIIPHGIKENTRTFAIKYQFSGPGKTALSAIDYINVVPIKAEANSYQRWCISKVNALSPVDLLLNVDTKN